MASIAHTESVQHLPELASMTRASKVFTDQTDVVVASAGLPALKIVLGIFALTLLSTGGQYFIEAGQLPSYVHLYMGATVLVIYLMIGRNSNRLAFGLFAWACAVAPFVASLVVAGIYTPSLLLLPIAIMVACWALGPRHGLLICGVSIAGIATLTWGHEHGWMPRSQHHPVFWALTYTGACIITATFGITAASRLRAQFQRACELRQSLEQSNAELEQRVTERTAELNASLERLQRAQYDLVKAEKLAALGNIVAGVSHELNTPIGNGVTMSSALSANLSELRELIEGETLRRSDLRSRLDEALEMCALIERSFLRSASLVQSFKQFAVDEAEEYRSRFDLRAIISHVAGGMRNDLTEQSIELLNQVPEGIVCDSFPGVLEQILVNLVDNAAIHGLAGRTEGRIEISTELREDQVCITVRDNGCGMDTVTLCRVFDPFFTTRLGKGRSGLGLALCWRMANTVLAGELRAESSPEQGSRFTLSMPLTAPARA